MTIRKTLSLVLILSGCDEPDLWLDVRRAGMEALGVLACSPETAGCEGCTPYQVVLAPVDDPAKSRTVGIFVDDGSSALRLRVTSQSGEDRQCSDVHVPLGGGQVRVEVHVDGGSLVASCEGCTSTAAECICE